MKMNPITVQREVNTLKQEINEIKGVLKQKTTELKDTRMQLDYCLEYLKKEYEYKEIKEQLKKIKTEEEEVNTIYFAVNVMSEYSLTFESIGFSKIITANIFKEKDYFELFPSFETFFNESMKLLLNLLINHYSTTNSIIPFLNTTDGGPKIHSNGKEISLLNNIKLKYNRGITECFKLLTMRQLMKWKENYIHDMNDYFSMKNTDLIEIIDNNYSELLKFNISNLKESKYGIPYLK